jgi:hypothetical protein
MFFVRITVISECFPLPYSSAASVGCLMVGWGLWGPFLGNANLDQSIFFFHLHKKREWRLTDALYKSRLVSEYRAVRRMRIGKGNGNNQRKLTPVPLRPPQIPRDRTRDWTGQSRRDQNLNKKFLGFWDSHSAAIMKIFFWTVTPCSLVDALSTCQRTAVPPHQVSKCKPSK